MNKRQELVDLIQQRKEELKKAGPIHARDLSKNIRRLERELFDFDRFQRTAQSRRESISPPSRSFSRPPEKMPCGKVIHRHVEKGTV